MAESSTIREQAVATTAIAENGNPSVHPEVGLKEEVVVPVSNEILLKQLANQLEYYFSTRNLAKDTYLSTLRSLNDGYVPITILANFGKVQSLVPYDSINAMRIAAQDHSDLLEVVRIHTRSGKLVAQDEEMSEETSLEAVGPVSGNPIPIEEIETANIPVTPPAIKATTSVQNTLILREVPEAVDEQQIQELFSFDKCPAITGLHPEVANCWYVSLDTTSRDDVITAMFELRTKKYASGEAVQVRLKAGVVSNTDSPAGFTGSYNPAADTQYFSSQANVVSNGGSRKNKKKKNAKQTGSNNNETSGNGSNNKAAKKNGANTAGSRRSSSGSNKQKSGSKTGEKKQDGRSCQNNKGTKKSSQQSLKPPSLGEEQFPSLPTELESRKIEVEKVPEDYFDKSNRNGSDSASTATTSSSSSSSKTAFGGYAAALLKAASPKAPQPRERLTSATPASPSKFANEVKQGRKRVTKNSSQQPKQSLSVAVQEATPVLRVQPPSWGGGKSFADALKKESAAVHAAAQPSA